MGKKIFMAPHLAALRRRAHHGKELLPPLLPFSYILALMTFPPASSLVPHFSLCLFSHITCPYRPRTLCGNPGAPPRCLREAVSAAHLAGMRLSWTDMVSMACSETC